MNRLGSSNTKMETGFITLGELAKHLKVDRNIVAWWIQKHSLPCIQKVTRRSKKYYLIEPADFWKWAEKIKIKYNSLILILLLYYLNLIGLLRKEQRTIRLIRKKVTVRGQQLKIKDT